MVINQKFFINGFKGIIHKSPNMDTLVALGSGASFAYSTYALFAMTVAQAAGDMQKAMSYMDELYFESAAMILTLITVGKMLEAHSKGKTTDALKGLMSLTPKTANVIVDGIEKYSRSSRLKRAIYLLFAPAKAYRLMLLLSTAQPPLTNLHSPVKASRSIRCRATPFQPPQSISRDSSNARLQE